MTNRILLLLLLPFWCTWYISLSQDMAINRQGAEDLLRRGYSFDLADKPDSALICFRRAADVFCEMQVWESARYCLNGMGRALIRSGKFTAAFSPLKRARELPVGQSQSDRVELAKTFELTGYVHSYQDQADSAMLYLKEAVTIRERYFAEDHVGLSQSLYLLGVVTLKKGTPEDALVHLQRALRIEQRSDRQDHRNLANILIATGNAFEAKGEYVLSIRFYSEALSTVGEAYAAPSPAEAACHFYLGESYRKLGEYGKAVDHLQTALRINRDLSGDISQAVLSCHKQLGDLFLARGDWDEALASYHACLSLIAELNGDRHSSVGDIYCTLSMVYREKGEPDTALVYSLRALDIQQSALGPNHPDLGFTLEAIGSIHAEKHDYAASLQYYHAALSLRRSVSTPEGLDIAAIASRIGSLYSRMGTADSAEAYLGNALRIIENTPGEGMQLRSRTLRELGEINCRRGDLAGGLFFYNEAIAALSRPSSTVNAGSGIEFDSAIELVAIRKAQADAFARSYENTHALSDLQNGFHALDEASRIIGRQRRLLRAEGSKFAIEEQNISLHEQAAGMALELYRKTGDTTYLHAAHETVERNKAGVLLDALRESNARHFAGIPDSLIARERILRGQLAQCAIEMQKPGALGVPLSRQQHNDLVRRQLVLNNEFHQLVESFRDRFPEYYDLQFDEDLVSGQVQVPGGCTLLQYFVGDKSLFIFTMRGNELDAQVLPKPREFEGLISSLRSSIKTIDPNGFVTSSTALYSLLIKPVEHHLTGSRHIIVVPDGPLYAVPFEALVSSVPDTAASGKRIDF
ncbi:MAG: tetratricopeptide repeat protein, partial [Ignavibacteria bacterium]|nr:tetratricopeptide repeat protein [Ignavibacteria bacterium]